MKKIASLALAFIFAILMPICSFAASPVIKDVPNISTTATSSAGTVYEYSGYVPFLVNDYFTVPSNKNTYLFFACTEACTVEISWGDVLIWKRHFTSKTSSTKYLIKSNLPAGKYRIAISADTYDSCFVSASIMPTQYT